MEENNNKTENQSRIEKFKQAFTKGALGALGGIAMMGAASCQMPGNTYQYEDRHNTQHEWTQESNVQQEANIISLLDQELKNNPIGSNPEVTNEWIHYNNKGELIHSYIYQDGSAEDVHVKPNFVPGISTIETAKYGKIYRFCSATGEISYFSDFYTGTETVNESEENSRAAASSSYGLKVREKTKQYSTENDSTVSTDGGTITLVAGDITVIPGLTINNGQNSSKEDVNQVRHYKKEVNWDGETLSLRHNSGDGFHRIWYTDTNEIEIYKSYNDGAELPQYAPGGFPLLKTFFNKINETEESSRAAASSSYGLKARGKTKQYSTEDDSTVSTDGGTITFTAATTAIDDIDGFVVKPGTKTISEQTKINHKLYYDLQGNLHHRQSSNATIIDDSIVTPDDVYQPGMHQNGDVIEFCTENGEKTYYDQNGQQLKYDSHYKQYVPCYTQIGCTRILNTQTGEVEVTVPHTKIMQQDGGLEM